MDSKQVQCKALPKEWLVCLSNEEYRLNKKKQLGQEF